jgi:hypothetical protein
VLRHHASGEKFVPSASETNAFVDAALWVQANRGNSFETSQRPFQPPGVIHVKINGEVNVDQYGFALLTEPAVIPATNDAEDDPKAIEMTNRICFLADAPAGDEDWWTIYSQYNHPVILQEPYRYREELFVPAIAFGLSYCRLLFTSPGADKPNTFPTTAWPTSATSATAAPGGPLKIVWKESSAGTKGFRWALVKVDSWMDTPTFLRGVAAAAITAGNDGNVTLNTALGTVTAVATNASFFDVLMGDPVGIIWDAQVQEYVIIARLCA